MFCARLTYELQTYSPCVREGSQMLNKVFCYLKEMGGNAEINLFCCSVISH
jgi:hypothetical protein